MLPYRICQEITARQPRDDFLCRAGYPGDDGEATPSRVPIPTPPCPYGYPYTDLRIPRNVVTTWGWH